VNTARFNNAFILDFVKQENNCSRERLLFSGQRRKIAVHSAVPYSYRASADRQTRHG